LLAGVGFHKLKFVIRVGLMMATEASMKARVLNTECTMAEDPSVELLARWRAGDTRAEYELFNRYTSQLIAFARRRLSAQVARRVDAEDVVQSAYRCFCAAARDDHIVLYHSGDLWRLLAKITLNKLCKQVEYHTAAKRAVGRDQTFGGESSLSALGEAMARTPSPSEAIDVVEELELVLKGLAPHHRRMVELRLQGYHIAEIAQATDRSERLVRRVLDEVKVRLKYRCCEPSDTDSEVE
jgi:RNA polymerase sigma-70 factor (ECF subfamily)